MLFLNPSQPGRVEDYLLEYINQHSDIKIEHGKMPESLEIDVEKVESEDEYPVTVTVRTLTEEAALLVNGTLNGTSNRTQVPNGMFRSNLNGDTTDAVLATAQADEASQTETIRAKYVVGCDGAHSWTRRQIGSVMEGEQTDFIWFVNHTLKETKC